MRKTKNLVLVSTSAVSIFALVLSLHFYSINKELQEINLKVNEKYNDVLTENGELQVMFDEMIVENTLFRDDLNKASATIEQASTENKKLQKDVETLIKQNKVIKDRLQKVSDASSSGNISRGSVYTGKKQETIKTAKETVVKETLAKSKEAASEWMTMSATYYTANCKGCSGITATGDNVKKTIMSKSGLRVIAVDPTVIPLRSVVEVSTPEGTFIAVASDTGGAIKGRKIDVLVKEKSTALSLGRDEVKIRILKK